MLWFISQPSPDFHRFLSPFSVFLDRCSASGGDGPQDASVDVYSLLAKPPTASTAAVARYQGLQTRGPHPQQEHQQHPSSHARKAGSFLSAHSSCRQRGPWGNLANLYMSLFRLCNLGLLHSVFPNSFSWFQSPLVWYHELRFSFFHPFAFHVFSLLILPCLLVLLSLSFPLSACCSCSPLSDSLPGSWILCQFDLWTLLAGGRDRDCQ